METGPGAPPLPEGRGRVAFRAVGFRYDGVSDAALSGLSFVAEPGRTVALVGPSGAGKSTAISLVPRLYDATSGTVEVDGADVRGVDLASLRAAIAYVGQDAVIFDDTALANIACGRPGAAEVEFETQGRAPVLEILVNRDALRRYNLHAAEVNRAIATALAMVVLSLVIASPYLVAAWRRMSGHA